jgi:hypothetical protein
MELLGTNPLSLIDPEDIVGPIFYSRMLFAGAMSKFRMEMRLATKDHGMAWFKISFQALCCAGEREPLYCLAAGEPVVCDNRAARKNGTRAEPLGRISGLPRLAACALGLKTPAKTAR